jgi:hypothetical protein
VHGKRQRLHLARLQQVVLIDRGERSQVRQGTAADSGGLRTTLPVGSPADVESSDPVEVARPSLPIPHQVRRGRNRPVIPEPDRCGDRRAPWNK